MTHSPSLRSNSRHFAAFLGASLAGVSAALAMIGLVLATFCRAGVTSFGTDAAKILGEL